MNQQYPQQPQQPGWGQQPHQHPHQPGWGAPPPPPKKSPVGMIVGLGCLGVVVLLVIIGAVGAVVGSDSSTSKGTSVSADDKNVEPEKKDDAPAAEDKPTEPTEPTEEPTKEKAKEEPKKETKKPVVTFKVWGTAPAGVLGPLDITYGSDSDTRKGKFSNGKFTATLPLDDDAMYYTVMAQLQGDGDINCSVTVEGHTEKAHAAGGYNICHAQANGGLLGGWD